MLLVAIASPLTARPGGVASGTEEYDCGGSCHDKTSSAVIAMSASNLTVPTNGTVTVTVDVSGSQSGSILGVMIVSSLSPIPESIPGNAGWNITADPSGTTTYNYYEATNYAGSATLEWTLRAPSTSGVYPLFARVMHGGGQAYAVDDVSGLSFVVGNAGSLGAPTVMITSPVANEETKGIVTVDANIPSNQPIAYATLTVDGVLIGNKSSAPYSWTIDTNTYADGTHVINITAVDTMGNHGYKQVTVTFNNAGSSKEILAWLWTMAAGSIAIVAWVGVLIVAALVIRKRHIEKVGKEEK